MKSAMNGGDGANSYFKNSKCQRNSGDSVKRDIEDEIYKNLDVKTLSSVSNTIRLADLGCSTGPNTFLAMQNLLEIVKLKHSTQCPNTESPEFQVFFSDQTCNDFNTLFTSLPEKQYFAAGVPGSFHDRLFPKASLHFVYSCASLHWLSKVPEQVLNKNSPAWNKERIYYVDAPREVYEAYRSQFQTDIDSFLSARAKEIVQGGMMVIIMEGLPSEVDSQSLSSATSLSFDIIGSTYIDMAKEGLISETMIDSFNIPIYSATPDEMLRLVERNGCFSPRKIEFRRSKSNDNGVSGSNIVKHFRAGLEGMLSKHFGSEVTNEMFEKLDYKFKESNDLILSLTKEPSGQLFIVLMRK